MKHTHAATETQSMTRRPASADVAPHFAGYVARVPAGDLIAILAEQIGESLELLGSPQASTRAEFRYAPGKWSLKQVVGHMSDVERVLSYRLLRFARADATPLPGFDENDYAAASDADARRLDDLAAEFAAVRAATLALLRALPAPAWDRRGRANQVDFTVLGLATIITGHELHHRDIIGSRYLTD